MFFLITSFADSWQATSTAVNVSNGSRSNRTNAPVAVSSSSDKTSLHSTRTETCNFTSVLQPPNCSFIASAAEVKPQKCTTSPNETHGNRHHQDCALKEAVEDAFNIVEYFFSAGDTNSGDNVFRHPQERMGNRNATHDISNDIPQNEFKIRNMNETEACEKGPSNITAVFLNKTTLESFRFRIRNISEVFLSTREYDKGKNVIKEFDSYLTHLELVIQAIKKLNISLRLYNLSDTPRFSLVNFTHTFRKWELELHNERHRYREICDVFMEVKVLEIFRRYVDPTVYSVIFAVGFVWNGLLLFIFVRHRHLWTSANIMIFNLVVVDVLSLILNVPVFYFAHYHVPYFQTNEYACKLYITLRALFVAVGALSVVALSILRCVACSKSVTVYSREQCKLPNRVRISLYVLAVWVLATGFALPYSFVLQFTVGKCFTYGDNNTAKKVALSEFVLYCVVLPCTMVVFNVLTAKRLRESNRNISSAMRRNGQDVIRKRSANVHTALIAVFLISYIPQYLWRVLYRWLVLDIWQVSYRCIDKVTYYMLFASCCFNPMSLYGVSRRFRNLLNYYFLYLCNHHCNKNSNSDMQMFPRCPNSR